MLLIVNEQQSKTILLILVKCRTQVDCVWVVDESGATICIEDVSALKEVYKTFANSTCRCLDSTRRDIKTGRCVSQDVKASELDTIFGRQTQHKTVVFFVNNVSVIY